MAAPRNEKRDETVGGGLRSMEPARDDVGLAKEQVTAIGMDLLKGATELEAIEPLGFDVRAQEHLERLMGKELRA